jgi:hypothetical protein
LQQKLASVLADYEDNVFFLHWMGDYEVRRDNSGLSEAATRRFVDELMTMVRRGIDRKRTFSTSSGSSTASGQQPSTSTPRPRLSQSNLTTDLE